MQNDIKNFKRLSKTTPDLFPQIQEIQSRSYDYISDSVAHSSYGQQRTFNTLEVNQSKLQLHAMVLIEMFKEKVPIESNESRANDYSYSLSSYYSALEKQLSSE